MPTASKSSKKATTVAKETTDIFTPVYLDTVTRVAELQKNSLDLVAEQTNAWIGAWKKAFSALPVSTPTFFFDLAGQAVQTAIETQKSAIDLVVEQSEAVAEIAQERARAYSKIAGTASSAFQATITRSVEAQKKALEFAAEQTKSVCEATKKQMGDGPAAVIVDTIEKGANTLIEAQKSLLEATTGPFVS